MITISLAACAIASNTYVSKVQNETTFSLPRKRDKLVYLLGRIAATGCIVSMLCAITI